jgi:hypothetical protein
MFSVRSTSNFGRVFERHKKVLELLVNVALNEIKVLVFCLF